MHKKRLAKCFLGPQLEMIFNEREFPENFISFKKPAFHGIGSDFLRLENNKLLDIYG